jgi:hypothetical protein
VAADETDQHLLWPQPDPTWFDRTDFFELLHYAEAEAREVTRPEQIKARSLTAVYAATAIQLH